MENTPVAEINGQLMHSLLHIFYNKLFHGERRNMERIDTRLNCFSLGAPLQLPGSIVTVDDLIALNFNL